MFKNSSLILLACLLFFSTSCEDTFTTIVEVDLPEVDKDIAVSAFALAGQPIQIVLNEVVGILDNSDPSALYVKDATVDLYQGETLLETILPTEVELEQSDYYYSSGGTTYTKDVFISTIIAEAGQSYSIKANVPGYELAEATTTIPNPLQILRAWVSDTLVNDPENGEQIEVSFEIADNAEEKNYYSVSQTVHHVVDGESYYRNYGCFNSYDLVFDPPVADPLEEIYYLYETVPWYCDRFNTFKDNLFEGETKVIKLLYSKYLFEGIPWQVYRDRDDLLENPPEIEKVELILEFISLNKEMYLYSKSAYLQSYNDGNPFAEPVNVLSNANPYGVFGGYLKEEVAVELPF